VADPLSGQRHSRPSRSGPADTVGGEFSGADLLVHAACPLLFAGNWDQLLAPEMEILGCMRVRWLELPK
jgi:hypothetical protein